MKNQEKMMEVSAIFAKYIEKIEPNTVFTAENALVNLTITVLGSVAVWDKTIISNFGLYCSRIPYKHACRFIS